MSVGRAPARLLEKVIYLDAGPVIPRPKVRISNNLFDSNGEALFALSREYLVVEDNIAHAVPQTHSGAMHFDPGARRARIEHEPAHDAGGGRKNFFVAADQLDQLNAGAIADPDVVMTSELGDGFKIAFMSGGQWLQYTVDVKLGGTFHIEFRLPGREHLGATLHLQVDGATVAGPVALAKSGDFSEWRRVTKSGVSLTAGKHTVRILFDAAGSTGVVADFNYFRLMRSDLQHVAPLPPKAPAAPAELTVTAISASRIDLAWTPGSDDHMHFKIERALRGQRFATIAVCPGSATTYSDTGLATNKKYYYRIRATSAGGTSPASNVARTTTLAGTN
jgi:hypothetical protein